MPHISRHCLVSAFVVTSFVVLAGCSAPDPMRLDSTLRLDGPVTVNMNMQMEGPASRYTGTFVSEALFEAIELKETRIEWVIATFGEPDRRADTSTGGEYLVWDYRADTVQGHPLRLTGIGDDENQTPSSMTVTLEVVNGIVLRKWRG
ncbi:MAG: hypothetical protein R3B46_03255 [Phycisphaerales bacterium]|nr:hypothetical protein [Phycisphaerales bacterium]